eukprot:TRINITY_DN1859_c0_g1_i2.p1 TRINITY_DN1859_c0_g1~~TRINITY_DN1859_c0_g1_i2.p1  ORF type:complete len:181 (+),score=24.62 TRINITY_DN1859_c0_g1_i2:59-601(+)
MEETGASKGANIWFSDERSNWKLQLLLFFALAGLGSLWLLGKASITAMFTVIVLYAFFWFAFNLILIFGFHQKTGCAFVVGFLILPGALMYSSYYNHKDFFSSSPHSSIVEAPKLKSSTFYFFNDGTPLLNYIGELKYPDDRNYYCVVPVVYAGWNVNSLVIVVLRMVELMGLFISLRSR